jgi:hypothetical protein
MQKMSDKPWNADEATDPSMPGGYATIDDSKKPRTDLAVTGKILQALALLSAGVGMGYSVLDWNFKWALLGLIAFVTLGSISQIFKKG